MSSPQQEQQVVWDIQWRDSKNERVKFCSSEDFFNSQVIAIEAKGLYDKYIKETDPKRLEKNDKGYYKTTWSYDDKKLKFTFAATYDDQYQWGIMRVPIKENQKAQLDRIETKINKLLDYCKIQY